ncbi:MAG: SDR family oxidoreductase [Novosphingobium sp.]|nr:SDR family oxidoreductase [Novosphingobium sp.]
MAILDGKKIVLVGGATGIGQAAARAFVSHGASVVIGDTNIAGAVALAGELRALGGNVDAVEADLASEVSMQAAIAFARERLGAINGLFLNGADTRPATLAGDTDIVAMDLDLWDHVLAVNLRGYMLGARFAIPVMLENGGGTIVCTSSEFSFASQGIQPAYCASKAAVNQLIGHIAARFGREGIRCNGIAPGFILTETAALSCPREILDHWERTVLGPRLGTPEDIAAMAVFLMSEQSAYVQGQTISVNGGTLMR